VYCKIERSCLSGDVVCPSSKSYTHRAVFLASLADGPSTIENALLSADTQATIAACRKMGSTIFCDDSTLKVEPGTIRPGYIDAANSGTTLRMATAISALAGGTSQLTGDSSLKKRPMQPLLDALDDLGAACTSRDGRPPVSVSGKIAGGSVVLPGNVSSQFASALLMAAPLTRNGMELTISGKLVSKPYLDATIHSMRRFGVNVSVVEPFVQYRVEPQRYRCTNFTVPSDASGLALILSASVLAGSNVCIRANLGDLPQGDRRFMDILNALGAPISQSDEIISASGPDKLGGGTFDLRDTPDLLPPLAILAAKAGKPVKICNIGHARVKETDRIAIIAREIAKVGIGVKEHMDSLVLSPAGKLSGAHLSPHGDHRLFMAFCILGMFVGNCTVSDPESARISYPGFVDDMVGLGARITVHE